MTSKEKVLKTLGQAKKPICDDCLSQESQVRPRQAVYQICAALGRQDILRRKKVSCGSCGKRKLTSCIVEQPAASQPPGLRRRVASLVRETGETSVTVSINLDGTGRYEVDTGNGFLDHMVSQVARHGLIDITLKARGDVHTGWHHLVEDVAIMLGRAFRQALGDARGIRRMGHAIVPLDEALALVAVDCGGRPHAAVKTTLDDTMVETLSGDLIRHFLESFAVEGRISLHAKVLAGVSPHHKAEALCKALARALRDALEPDPRAPGQVPSTKGTIAG
jgi:imidazoleglycerol-phosphate dehydratase